MLHKITESGPVALVRKLKDAVNAIIDEMSARRLVAGRGIAINRHPSGTVISATATGGASAPMAVAPDGAVKGPFAVTLEGGTTIKVWDSSGGEGAGIVTIGSYSERVGARTFPVQTGEVYLDVTYTGGTVGSYSMTLRIAAAAPSPSSAQQYILRLGGCTFSGGTAAGVYPTRAPGDIEVLGRWTL